MSEKKQAPVDDAEIAEIEKAAKNESSKGLIMFSVAKVETLLKALRQRTRERDQLKAELEAMQKKGQYKRLNYQLKAELEAAEKRVAELESLQETSSKVVDDVFTMQRQRDQLANTLREYGTHDPLCAIIGGYDHGCTCGYEQALKEAGLE